MHAVRITLARVGALVTPTPELAHIVGSKPLSRADDNLRPVFDGAAQLSMFEMTAYISRHLVKQ